MRFCVVDEGAPCNCDVCIELPALPSCAEGDVVCYKRYIKAAVARASRLMYISPQVVDLQVKTKALDNILEKMPLSVPLKASHTPWGPVLYAAPENAPVVPHYVPKYVIKMKEKEYDEFQPLGTIADAINRMLEIFGEFPQLFQLFATMYISAVIESNLPVFVQYAVEDDSMIMPAIDTRTGTLYFNIGLKPVAAEITCFSGKHADETTLIAAVLNRAKLIDAIDRALCPTRNYQDTDCLYDDVNSAASTISAVLANQVGFEVVNIIHVRALHTKYSTYFGKHKIETTGGFAVNQAVASVDIQGLIQNAAAAAKNLFKPLYLTVDVTVGELTWNCGS